MNAGTQPFRPVHLGHFKAAAETRGDGTILIRPDQALGAYPRSIVDALEMWANKTPNAMLIADRDGETWRRLSFAEVLARIKPLGQALLDAGLSAERPLMIISGNEIEHFLLGLPPSGSAFPMRRSRRPIRWSRPISASSGTSPALLTPGMVYASDGRQFAHGHRCSFRARYSC